MEIKYHPVKAQQVGCGGRNLVDSNFTVDMLHPIIDGAYVDIRDGSSIPKVHRYTCCGAKTLQKENKILSLILCH